MQDVGRQGEKVEYLKPNGLVFYQVYKITTVTDLSAANFSAKKHCFQPIRVCILCQLFPDYFLLKMLI